MNNVDTAFIESHIWMKNRRIVIRDSEKVYHYRIEYDNGDTYEYKSEYKDYYKTMEHVVIWINGKKIGECDYEYHNFGWRKVS